MPGTMHQAANARSLLSVAQSPADVLHAPEAHHAAAGPAHPQVESFNLGMLSAQARGVLCELEDKWVRGGVALMHA